MVLTLFKLRICLKYIWKQKHFLLAHVFLYPVLCANVLSGTVLVDCHIIPDKYIFICLYFGHYQHMRYSIG